MTIKDSGFEFDSINHRLRAPRLITEKEIRKLGKTKVNDGSITVKCSSCGVHMDFTAGPKNSLDGKWVCPSCKTIVREKTPYTKLANQNAAYTTRIYSEKVPSGCSACGGPYPSCKTSCNVFD
jgi:uncharacterized C2H2 Zn-finger protein